MEAAAVARRAFERSLPFYCIRAVSDALTDGFHLDFNRMRDDAGRFSRARIAGAALKKPWTHVPELVRLDWNCRLASRRLGDFLVTCRF
jgi:hypothetical protein